MKLLSELAPGRGSQPLRRGDPFWWLRDQEALVRRFVLTEVLGEPPCRQTRRGPPRPGARR
jgi:hypothetical protein